MTDNTSPSNKLLFSIFIGLFLLTFSNLNAQYSWTQGQLLLKNGDTLSGEIRLPVVSKNVVNFGGKEKVRYRKTSEAKTTKFKEEDVAKIIFHKDQNTATFIYVPTSKRKKEIFEIVTRGKATLYARRVSVSGATPMFGAAAATGMGPLNYWSYSFDNYNEFYVMRSGETVASPLITIRLSRSFRKRAIDYFDDCPSLTQKLEQKLYEEEDIKTVIETYNACE